MIRTILSLAVFTAFAATMFGLALVPGHFAELAEQSPIEQAAAVE